MFAGARIFSRSGIVGALALAVVMVILGSVLPSAASDGVPVPTPAKGAGDKCVADTDFMRRYHMTTLKHQRDDTVHDGIRTKQFSLKGCIDCHAVEGDDAKPVDITDGRHFCRSCHDYAAVSVDCFECHASVPGNQETATAPGNDSVAALNKFMEDHTQ